MDFLTPSTPLSLYLQGTHIFTTKLFISQDKKVVYYFTNSTD